MLKKGSTIVATDQFVFSATNSFKLQYSDPTAVDADNFTVVATTVTQPSNFTTLSSLTINGNSYLRVTSTPPSTTGPASSINYWSVTNDEITPDNLSPYYGQKQQNISGSGFNPITLDFSLQLGDEFRFDGTETQTYTIISQSVASNKPVFHVNRNVNAGNTDWFLVRRYITDPSYLILEVDKPAGGTSSGVLTPEYFYGDTEEKVDSILQKLTRDNLI